MSSSLLLLIKLLPAQFNIKIKINVNFNVNFNSQAT